MDRGNKKEKNFTPDLILLYHTGEKVHKHGSMPFKSCCPGKLATSRHEDHPRLIPPAPSTSLGASGYGFGLPDDATQPTLRQGLRQEV